MLNPRGILLLIVFLSTVPLLAQAPKSAFFKTSDNIRIHYLDAGSGRPIVFIPGWTMPAWIWQNQIDTFSKKYRVIAVDPRSQGESDKPTYGHLPETRARDYKELVEHLGLKQPVLVGWSLGCGELMKYVDQFGTENVAGLVLVDGFLWDKPNPDLFMGMASWMNQRQQDREKQTDDFVRSMFKKPQAEAYLKRVVDASLQVPDDTAVVLIYDMIAVKDFSTALAKVDRPLMFAHTPQTQQTADLLQTRLGDNVRLERFGDDGHALFVDDPERFNRVLEDFVQKLPN
jgi:non-heme chloroperoxidase